MKAQQGFRRFRIRGGDKQIKKYIEDLREQIVRAVNPQQIILFGSYAYGTPNENSDVDLLVVMPFKGSPLRQAFKLRMQMVVPRAVDLLVRTPEQLAERLAMGDSFVRELLERGQVLYESHHARVDRKGGRRLGQRAIRGAQA